MASMRQSRRRKRLMGEINVVPYIDVMLVLLVIFIITAPLLQQGVKVDLPQTQANPMTTKTLAPLIISIDRKGNYYLNRQHAAMTPLAAPQLIEAIKQRLAQNKRRGGEQTVFVEGDKVVRYGQVMQLMGLLQGAGINRVGLITTPPEAVTRHPV